MVTFAKHPNIPAGTTGIVDQVNREPLYYSVRLAFESTTVHVNATDEQLESDSP